MFRTNQHQPPHSTFTRRRPFACFCSLFSQILIFGGLLINILLIFCTRRQRIEMADICKPVNEGRAPEMLSILCCMCGIPIKANPSNTCATCLASQSDVTRGISTEATLHQCRGCQRWHKDAGKWIACELESRELMSLCLANVPGLNNNKNGEKVRLVDASWIWTEPHSMRLKVRLTIQKEVQKGTILQQTFVVVFVVRNQQCIECQAEFRQGSWKNLVQVRQRVQHKRTFLYLEQLILKHGAHRGCLSIETFRDGMDFYFPDKGKANRFISFIEQNVPIKVRQLLFHLQCFFYSLFNEKLIESVVLHSEQNKSSKKLISTDVKSNISNYKFTNLIEICTLCKDDLLYLPKKTANNLGNISRLVLVKNISNVINLVDPFTGQTAQMSPEVYWRDPLLYRPIVTAGRSRFTRFVILGKDPVVLLTSKQANQSKRRIRTKHRNRLASLTLAKEADLGINDNQHAINSHVGYLMKSGDVCIGYDLTEIQFAVDDDAEDMRNNGNFPDTVILRKLYGGVAANEEETVAAKKRVFRLQRLDVDAMDDEYENDKKSKKKMNAIKQMEEMDEEDFLREIEADKEMRSKMNLYKARNKAEEGTDEKMANDDDDEDSDDDQKIQLDELLDGLVLDSNPRNESNNNNEIDEDESWGMKSNMMEGEKAAQDGINYLDREASRNIKDKETATTVKDFGTEFMDKKINFI